MSEQPTEGVIKYQLSHQKKALSNPPIQLLNSWRLLLKNLDMVGQHPNRYQGYGFGNLSQRLTPLPATHNNCFLITGTQTGGLAQLSAADYAMIIEANPTQNQLTAEGLCAPSSEALSHAIIYQTLPQINFIFHIHCPIIWQYSQQLTIPCLPTNLAYGTPAMAQAIASLVQEKQVQSHGIISMLGHEDGLISFGKTADEAGWPLIHYWVLAHTV
ncbi:class II aldolase/adducin family protein [Spartinivicinus ruber]|uniref:class II aldolase/adducin family protein n=1 Tax=Spartinivicinus ruber TaxID=2683272 RepID=UPI0013D5BDD6|nr:class II aldolase/adducin family protein [Spartinivicinus ruber]